MLMMASIFAIHAGSAACPASANALRADVAVAMRAYDDWAWEAFDQGVASVRADLGCLTEVVSGLDAKAAHLVFALAGARGQDEALAVAAFSGLLALEPGYEPDPVLAPRGSLLRRAWERARVEVSHGGQPLPAGHWFVDGEPGASQLPSGRAAVVQVAASSGGFLSWYLDGGELPASLEERLKRPLPAAAFSQSTQEVRPLPVVRIAGAVSLLGAGLGLGLVALDGYQDWENAQDYCTTVEGGCEPDQIELKEENMKQAIGFGIGAGAAALLGIGVGISVTF